jgi:DNA-binding transcriptional LysR family regulator
MVASLDARLGVKPLLQRVAPTDTGRVFLERARQILGDLDVPKMPLAGQTACAAHCG